MGFVEFHSIMPVLHVYNTCSCILYLCLCSLELLVNVLHLL